MEKRNVSIFAIVSFFILFWSTVGVLKGAIYLNSIKH